MSDDLDRSITDHIARIWCDVLDLPQVGLADNFFDVGGTPFQLLLVKDRLDTELATSTELVSFFRYTTVAALAEHVYGRTASN
ncbi:phosphopantetheine-binding protein [Nocardia pseudobrasiliensis]|uniref:Phosphopantetheine binding protein n=1 Tax=Nocardia pseudobrasiliensis TaxID=45979 RepID=A0A370IBM7_9NOCA|nr:phosphopantetheine-binding protein [Nocardia pseudobrasiliensis]RDI68126.1 phosphopantetheine binding protein [Nocardia pseudobrasiliensis]